MKSRKLIYEVTEEVERVRVVRRPILPHSRICPECEVATCWITIQKAATELNISAAHLTAIIESDRLHFQPKPGGGILVCRRTVEQILAKCHRAEGNTHFEVE